MARSGSIQTMVGPQRGAILLLVELLYAIQEHLARHLLWWPEHRGASSFHLPHRPASVTLYFKLSPRPWFKDDAATGRALELFVGRHRELAVLCLAYGGVLGQHSPFL